MPLFRPEAIAEPEYGEAVAFAVPAWRTLGLLAGGALLLFLGFGLFAEFDRVAQVRGLIVPASGVARVAAPQPGIVTAVLARQGDHVARGAPLVRIASADFLPSGARAQAQVLETFRRQQQVALLGQVAERQRRDAEARSAANQVAELAAALDSLRTQAALQRERVDNNAQRLRNLAPLRAKGYVSEIVYQTQQEAVLSLRQQMAALRQREIETGHELERARLRLAELAAEARRAELQSAALQLELERGAAGAQVAAEVTLAAPVSGRLATLRAVPGMNVAASDELAAIVRGGDALEALLFVPPHAAGSLRPGQPVALRFDAFPYHRHGVGRGIVAEIASTATVDQPGAEPGYRVKVRLDGGRRFALRPDMTLTAAITLERRSLLDWLFAPLREQWRESRRNGGS